jgi:DNA-binding response OmpR family regulator
MPELREGYTVLVVDDNADLLDLLVDTLQYFGRFNVIGAADGIAGLEHYFTYHPDCIVIDVKMPGLDGYQLVRALRGDPASAATPVIILTALAQDKDRFTGLASGADRYIVKPIKPQDLAALIREVIGIAEEERQARMLTLAETAIEEERHD